MGSPKTRTATPLRMLTGRGFATQAATDQGMPMIRSRTSAFITFGGALSMVYGHGVAPDFADQELQGHGRSRPGHPKQGGATGHRSGAGNVYHLRRQVDRQFPRGIEMKAVARLSRGHGRHGSCQEVLRRADAWIGWSDESDQSAIRAFAADSCVRSGCSSVRALFRWIAGGCRGPWRRTISGHTVEFLALARCGLRPHAQSQC